VIKELGEHPELKGPVQVLSGRYGPYVKHGKVNATLPKDKAPEDITMAEAVALIAAKDAKGGKSSGGKARSSGSKSGSKSSGKKPAAKKATGRKSAKKEAVEETAG
jgi:DNA topoisomerase-1